MKATNHPTSAIRRRYTGIMGGSFNPVHTGHLLMAQDAAEYFELDRVFFIPCATPPHKVGTDLASAEHRLNMLKAAVTRVPLFEINTLEIERGGRSYSVDTVDRLRKTYRHDKFFFILGDDSLVDLPEWYRIDDLLEICEFVTLARPGVEIPAGAPAIEDARQREQLLSRRRVGHSLNVSSTEIRDRVASGRSIRYLVPDAVADYIDGHRLYRDSGKTKTSPASCGDHTTAANCQKLHTI